MSWLRDSMEHNMTVKLVSLAVAVLIWGAFTAGSSGQEAFEAAVRFDRVPSGMEINPDQASHLTVMLEGPPWRLSDLHSRGVVLEVDCADTYDEYEKTVNVTTRSLGLPPGITLVKSIPSQLRYSLEESKTRQVEVSPSFSGGYQEGYVLEGFWVEPQTLKVAGAAERVALVEQVGTDPIDLTGVIGGRSFRTTAFLSDPYLRFVGDATVTVEVRMRKR